MANYVGALDQGTTSTRFIIFDRSGSPVAWAQKEHEQICARPGWVEHDPEEIWFRTQQVIAEAMDQKRLGPKDLAAIGITNQRETTVLWDHKTGRPVYNAVVWQDTRVGEMVAELASAGGLDRFRERTGLPLSTYFSGLKIRWLLEKVPGVRERAEAGEILFGTIDSFLVWRLTGGRVHATDATNASRTLLYDLATGRFDDDLLRLFGVPRAILPEVRDSGADFGTSDPSILGAAVPIRGVAGDQQAASIGQACFTPGMVKATYGTGCFALLNTGAKRVPSKNRMLTTVAWQLAGKRSYALEGAIFVAGAAVQWLRDQLRLIAAAPHSGTLAAAADPLQEVVLVPAFVGLGAPYWQPQARGALFGLTRATGAEEIARAALEAVCYQTRDLVEAMASDWPEPAQFVLRVDGGMAASDWTMQFLADILNAPVERPSIAETTALGAAWLAGYTAGVWPDSDGFAKLWRRERTFAPTMPADARERRYARWQRAVRAVLAHAADG